MHDHSSLNLRVCWQFLQIHILITSDIKVLIDNLPCFAKKIFQKDALYIAKSELLSFWHAEQCNFCQSNHSVEYSETATGVCQESWLFIGNCHFRHGSAEGVGDGG